MNKFTKGDVGADRSRHTVLSKNAAETDSSFMIKAKLDNRGKGLDLDTSIADCFKRTLQIPPRSSHLIFYTFI